MTANTTKHDAFDIRKHYMPRYPTKYKGTYPIVCRSQWERAFCMMCDTNVNIIQWASEPERIPYPDPLSNKQKIYIPDFMITARMPNGGMKTTLIEIKPSHEALAEKAVSERDRLALARNTAKWAAAMWWCQRRGIDFRIMTEVDLFGSSYASPKKKRGGPRKPRAKKK